MVSRFNLPSEKLYKRNQNVVYASRLTNPIGLFSALLRSVKRTSARSYVVSKRRGISTTVAVGIVVVVIVAGLLAYYFAFPPATPYP